MGNKQASKTFIPLLPVPIDADSEMIILFLNDWYQLAATPELVLTQSQIA